MKLFIVAVPLFSSDMSVNAYNLHYQNSEKLFGATDDYTALDGAMSSPGLDMLNSVGIEPFTGGKPIFIPINKFLLLSDFTAGCKIPPGLIVLVLTNDLPVEPVYLEKCYNLKKAGFSLAISGIGYSDMSAFLYDMADYIFVDTMAKDRYEELIKIKNIYPAKRLVLTKISDISTFESLKMIPNTLFEGSFYNQPITSGVKNVSPLKTNALQLLKLIGDEDFQLEDVAAIIARDTSLSISILRFINSPAVGIPNKVNSIRQAVALLGQRETRKWIVTFVSLMVSDDKPNEVTKLSLTRARFAENLAVSFNMGIHAPALFMMGLFSLLDVILDKPMEEAIKEISVNNMIRDALVESKGEYYKVLELIYAYEHADWKTVSYVMIHNKIDPDDISNSFFNALLWYRDLLSNMK